MGFTKEFIFNLTDNDKKILIDSLNFRIAFTRRLRDKCEISPDTDHESNNRIKSMQNFLAQINNEKFVLTDYEAYAIGCELDMHRFAYKENFQVTSLFVTIIKALWDTEEID